MVVFQLGMIIASHPTEWPRTTLVVLGIMGFAHRCAHFVRHVSRSADSVVELKAVHHQQEIIIGQIGYQVNPDASLHLSSNAALRSSGLAEILPDRPSVRMKKTDVTYRPA